MTGKPNHVTTNQDKCVIMKWRTEKSYHGAAELGQWENINCLLSANIKPWVCSHEQSNEFNHGSYAYPTEQRCKNGISEKSFQMVKNRTVIWEMAFNK
mgnify:CR=1 FL=1